jgi:hypothetical protein
MTRSAVALQFQTECLWNGWPTEATGRIMASNVQAFGRYRKREPLCARNWALSTSDPSGFEAQEILGQDLVEPLHIAILHRMDVVAVERGQRIKVASRGCVDLDGCLPLGVDIIAVFGCIESHSHLPGLSLPAYAPPRNTWYPSSVGTRHESPGWA